MSKEALAKVVQRSISDAAFRRQLATDPTGALRGYDLSSDEKSALRSGDSARLSAFGVDQRMSKAFTLGEPTTVGATVNSAQISDLNAGTASGALTSSGSAAAGNATLTAGDSANAAGSSISNSETISDGAAGSNVIVSDQSRPDFAVTGGEPRDIAPAWIGEYSPSAGLGAQTPDAAERNAAFTGGESSRGAVQSPDAAERNADFTATDSGGAIQSPDAAERNLAAAFTGSAEPRDVAPTWIGDNQPLSSAMTTDETSVSGTSTFDPGAQDEGFLPTVGHMSDTELNDDASTQTDAGGGSIHQE